MKKVGNHNSISKNLIFSFAVLLALTLNSFAQTPPPATDAAAAAPTSGGDAVKGKELF